MGDGQPEEEEEEEKGGRTILQRDPGYYEGPRAIAVETGERSWHRGSDAEKGHLMMPDKRGSEMVAEGTDAADERPCALASGQVLQPAHSTEGVSMSWIRACNLTSAALSFRTARGLCALHGK